MTLKILLLNISTPLYDDQDELDASGDREITDKRNEADFTVATFTEGVPVGEGTRQVVDDPGDGEKAGERYKGDYVDGKRDGHGTYYYPNGGNYTGQWSDDKKHGNGIEIWPGGNRYDGKWVNNLFRSGKIEEYWSDGKPRYVGGYDNEKVTVSGTWYYANGDRYEGQFLNSKRHGSGKRRSHF